jgi:hypothetical protein
VNILLHRHFARRELGAPVAAFGAMLPDLVRMIDRGWRPRPDVEARSQPGDVVALLDGIEHHVAIDAWFHRRPELREGERRTAEAFRAAGATARRMPLLAHACWEMVLDGALARRLGPALVEAELERECDALAAPSVRALAIHAGPSWAPPSDAIGRLFGAVPSLAAGYASAPGLARRLDGLRASFGLGRAAPEELARWCDALAALSPHAELALATLEAARASST